MLITTGADVAAQTRAYNQTLAGDLAGQSVAGFLHVELGADHAPVAGVSDELRRCSVLKIRP
jgi:hypothetical protein